MNKSLLLLFRKIVSGFTRKTTAWSREKKIELINSFPEPINDFERTLFQYKCSMKRWGNFQCVILNFGAFVAIIPYLIKMKKSKTTIEETVDAIFFSDRISIDTVQDSIRKKYLRIKTVKIGERMSLSRDDLDFVKSNVNRRKVSPYYLLKLYLKLGMISYVIQTYNPKAIISYSEESFTTSLITKYCEEKGKKYICIQHGERLLELKLTFFRCSEYYLWDPFYIELFLTMKCEKNQFIVEQPQTVLLQTYNANRDKVYKYTFYLQDETEKSICIIAKYVQVMNDKGHKIAIRPHPQWTKMELLKRFPSEMIQNYREIDLSESLSMTESVIGKCSTVLFQAYSVGVPIVIDDVSDVEIFNEIKESDYILLNKKHKLLSELG